MKSKERREEPLGTMSYQTISKRSPPFWLLIGARKLVFFWHQSEARTAATVGTGLVRHCPQGLFSPFFTFLRSIYIFPPVQTFLTPFICPWVSKDVILSILIWSNHRHPLIIADSLLCPCGKKALESPYIFSKFTPHNMDTRSIRTLSTTLSVCINVLWPSFYCNLIS